MRRNRTYRVVALVVAAVTWTAVSAGATPGSTSSREPVEAGRIPLLAAEIVQRTDTAPPGLHQSVRYEVVSLSTADLAPSAEDRDDHMRMIVVAYPSDEALGGAAIGDALRLIPIGRFTARLGDYVTFDLDAMDRLTLQRLSAERVDRRQYIGRDGSLSYGIAASGAAGYGVTLITYGGTIGGAEGSTAGPPSISGEPAAARPLPLHHVPLEHAQSETDTPLPVLYEACYSNGYHEALLVKSAATKSPRSTFAIVKTLGGAAADVTFTDTTKAYHEVGLKIGGEGYASGAFVRTSQDHTVSATATVGPSQFKRIRGKWLWFRWNLKCATYGGAYETLAGYGEWRPDSWSGELEPFGGAKTTGWNWSCAPRWKIHAPDNLAYTVQTGTESTFHADVTVFGSNLRVKHGYERSSATTIAYRELHGTRYLCGYDAYPSLARKAKSSRTAP